MKLRTYLLFLLLFSLASDVRAGWERTYNFYNWALDWGFEVFEMPDGYVLFGTTDGGFTPDTMRLSTWIIRTNSEGHSIWTHRFSGGHVGVSPDVIKLSGGGYVRWLPPELMVLDEDCFVSWTVNYDTSYTYPGMCLETQDSGFFLISTYRFYDWREDTSQILFIRVTEYGDTLWTKLYPFYTSSSGKTIPTAALALSDSGFLVVCATDYCFYSPGPETDIYLMRVNSDGDTIWTKRFYDPTSLDYPNAVILTHDNNFVIVGCHYEYSIDSSGASIMKVDAAGNLLWLKEYGRQEAEAKSVIELSDGSFAIAGYYGNYTYGEARAWFLRADSLGDTLYTSSYDGYYDTWAMFQDIKQTSDSGFIAFGYCGGGETETTNYYLVKINPETSYVREKNKSKKLKIKILPNPFNSSCSISIPSSNGKNIYIEIFDLSGRCVFRRVIFPKNNFRIQTVIWKPNKKVKSGIYNVKISSGENVFTKKLIYIK